LANSGAETIVILENFAAVLQQALQHTRIRHVIVTRFGDMLGLTKGAIVNFVVRHVRRLVPRWDIPDAIFFRDAIEEGAALPWRAMRLGPTEIAFLRSI
jgi:long-chain acyl-CoA synthetase